MKVSLVVAQGPKAGTPIPVSKAEFVIGRDAGCNLRPASQAVSKRHCSVLLKNDRAYIQDLKSTNGTFVNKQQVQGERELKDGDQLSVGPLLFTVKIESAAQVPTQVEPKTKANTPSHQNTRPAPASTLPPPASGEPMDEDAIGSMLLTLTEEGELAGSSDEEMDGTTIMQMLKPEEVKKLEETGPYRPPPRATGDKDTTSAAKAILETYRRRPRS
jgi:pSer/pThr/pTyr-binding forkhead associated (FHA) protein